VTSPNGWDIRDGLLSGSMRALNYRDQDVIAGTTGRLFNLPNDIGSDPIHVGHCVKFGPSPLKRARRVENRVNLDLLSDWKKGSSS